MKTHSHHSHAGHVSDAGAANVFLRRFYWTTALLLPLLLLSSVGVKFLGVPDFPGREYYGFAISAVIFYFSLIFFEHAGHEIRSRRFGMMTLVSVAVASGFLFSVASTFLPYFGGMEFYLEISTLIWVLLFGHYLEARSTATAGSALQEVAKLLPKKAHLLRGGVAQDVDLAELAPGDTILVKPGEQLPADGTILEGEAAVNESLVTGESKPVARKKGDPVIAGSVCIDGSLTVRIEKTGSESTVGRIQKLVESAQMTKPQLQHLADAVAAWLTFIALGTAMLTVLIWSLVERQPLAFSLTLAVTVLVIACPHALGLAIPTVSTTATSLALRYGIFIKSLKKLEAARLTSFVAFDKTGTLTQGNHAVTDVVPFADFSEKEVLSLAAGLEAGSSHPLARALIEGAKQRSLSVKKISDFHYSAGLGVFGTFDGTTYIVGNKKFMEDKKLSLAKAEKQYAELVSQGKTVVLLANEREVLGLIAVADAIRPESKAAVEALHALGVKVAMITGDNEGVAAQVAKELGIDTYFANVLPNDKYAKIQELQERGEIVMMVGDGVNDAPALIQSHVGVAIGSGTDVTVEAGDIVLTRNNPADIPRILRLSRKVYGKMVQNLVWAVGYNLVAIPAAAGVFARWGVFLRPDVGAFLMALSSVIVVINAMQLRRIRLD